MFCSKCGKQLDEGTLFCPDCGEKVEKDINFSDVTNYAGQKVQQVSAGLQSQVQNFQQAQKEDVESRKIKDVQELFVNETEQQKAVIGGGYLSNMLSSGILGKGFGVLTDHRLYYRGKCFYKVGGHYMKTDEDCIIDLKDISSTGFTYTRRLWLLILAIISFVVFCFIGAIIEDAGVIMFGFVPFCVLALYYAVTTLSIYTVTYAGGNLSINVSFYKVDEIKAFDKALHLAKDELVSH